ncbi:MAG: 23S rRNA pseudouridine(1911/1915/1917) synthase RluD [Gammaproteobacteria bacterium]|jgi:23S rRNA pseudouridine1911/1915/1917 synthase
MRDPEVHECRIDYCHAGERLDRALAAMFPDYSRSRIQTWIREGHVRLDGRVPRPRDVVAGGEALRLEAVPERAPDLAPEPIPLDVIYEDDALLVINKPPGLVVHPGAGNPDGTLQNALLHHAPELAGVPRSGLIHRLDKLTSGLLVIARSLSAHTCLTEAMAAREIRREYQAVVNGVLTAGGTVDAPLARHPVDRVKIAVRQGGRRAVTHYRVLERYRAHSLLRLTLETGRTHQIRVHMAHIRHALVGDPVYGRKPLLPPHPAQTLVESLQAFHRQALHAWRLTLAHPADGHQCSWEAPLPRDMARLIDALRADLAEEGGL